MLKVNWEPKLGDMIQVRQLTRFGYKGQLRVGSIGKITRIIEFHGGCKNYCVNGENSPLCRDEISLYVEKICEYPNPPHKHAELIKAWADGADIEIKCVDGTWEVREKPTWNSNSEFRIKPEKTPEEIQIEELEQQARDLADKIAELKNR